MIVALLKLPRFLIEIVSLCKTRLVFWYHFSCFVIPIGYPYYYIVSFAPLQYTKIAPVCNKPCHFVIKSNMNLFFSKFKNQNISGFLICKTQNNLKKLLQARTGCNKPKQRRQPRTTWTIWNNLNNMVRPWKISKQAKQRKAFYFDGDEWHW